MKLPSLSKKTLSIDFGSREIKVIEGRYSSNNISISKAFKIDLPQDLYSDGVVLNRKLLVERIRQGLRDNKVNTESAYGVINSSEIIIREITIPKVPDEDVNSLLNYQLDDVLPVNPDDYVVNYSVLRTRETEEAKRLVVLLIGVPKTMVLEHLDIFKDLGLKPEVLDYQGNAMAKLLGYGGKVNGQYATNDLAVASVDLGYHSTNLTIAKNGKIEVSRVVPLGSRSVYEDLLGQHGLSLEEAEERLKALESLDLIAEDLEGEDLESMLRSSMDRLVEKIEAVFRYYITREQGNRISLIVLHGGLVNIEGIANIFSNHFNIPALVLENLEKVKSNGYMLEYANAIGGLIRKEVKR